VIYFTKQIARMSSFEETKFVPERLNTAMENLGNILTSKNFLSTSVEEPNPPLRAPAGGQQKKNFLLPEFSTDSIGDMVGGPILHNHQPSSMSKYDQVSRTRSRLQSLLEKHLDTPRSESTNHQFAVPLSPVFGRKEEDAAQLHKVFGACRPWNYSDFLNRLKTFNNPMNWFAKPDLISPVQCSLHGWCNTGLDTIYCFSCRESFKHSSGKISFSTVLFLVHVVALFFLFLSFS
jgi:hypothetical protein